MTELLWRVEIEGAAPVTGAAPAAPGALRVRCQAPAGILRTVTASLPCPMAGDERAFFNGYQTWTYCPEMGREDRLPRLGGVSKTVMDKWGFDRYGDYHFVDYPDKAGVFHGFSWCYFRRGDRYRLFASLDERPGYTIFRYDASRQELILERDCAWVKWPGGEYPAFDLYFAEGSEDEVFDGWFQAMGIKPRTTQRMVGWCSWYDRYGSIDEASVRSALEGCKGLLSPGDLFQIDDGWQPAVGDWVPEPVKFPQGIKPLVDGAHETGFLAGLWLSPFVCETKSAMFREHPDWLIKGPDGEPWSCGGNWSGFYALDIDLPQVREHLKGVFDRVLTEWGFDLVKLDFLYAAAPFGTERESRGGKMTRAMELLREWCGDKLILGCGVPVMPAFGLVDYCRVSCDVSLDWDDERCEWHVHRERVSTRQAMVNTIFRRQLNGRAYGSDPDVFFLRDENLRLTPAQRDTLAAVNALFSQILLISDDPSHYSEEQKRRYRETLALRDAQDVAVEADGKTLAVTCTLHGEKRRFEVKK